MQVVSLPKALYHIARLMPQNLAPRAQERLRALSCWQALRQPTWSPELAGAVLELREQCPRWGKDKLVVLLHKEGWEVSTSILPGKDYGGADSEAPQGAGGAPGTAPSFPGRTTRGRRHPRPFRGRAGPTPPVSPGTTG